jgi:hypothetical protein
LRQRELALWTKDHPTAQAVRKLAYASNRSDATYKAYINCCKSNGYFVVTGVVSSYAEESKEEAG